ncbi:GntR family transcriptional regulator [Elioraea sp.]|uniref:GntR family transcriptional regulator n=1 Tax=Elioraea sp. TaxID=2185103 RepID=UPI0025BFDD0D|nr:GntR family transcriptional regulator [Elioraea sp.]
MGGNTEQKRRVVRPGSRSVPRTTIAERVYEDIKERILDQTLAPGERLTMDFLCRELAVSSSPVREALARLESEKLVVSEVYAGYSVAPPPDPEYLRGLLRFRILVEGHCGCVGAPKRLPDVLKAMESAFDAMARTKKLGTRYREYRRFIQEDSRFHRAIVTSSGNPATIAIYANLHPILLQSRLYITRSTDGSPAEEVLLEHEKILAAFREGDGDAAEAAIRTHLEGGLRRLHRVGLERQTNG